MCHRAARASLRAIRVCQSSTRLAISSGRTFVISPLTRASSALRMPGLLDPDVSSSVKPVRCSNNTITASITRQRSAFISGCCKKSTTSLSAFPPSILEISSKVKSRPERIDVFKSSPAPFLMTIKSRVVFLILSAMNEKAQLRNWSSPMAGLTWLIGQTLRGRGWNSK